MRSVVLALVVGVALGQTIPTSDPVGSKSKSVVPEKDKGEIVNQLTDLQPSASSPFGPSIFAQSFALRRVAPLMRYPRLGYGPRIDNDEYPEPTRGQNGEQDDNPQETFQKRGGSVGYGGVYPLKFNRGRGGGHGQGPGYGGRYNSGHSPRYNNERSEDDVQGYDGDYGSEYDDYDEGGEGNQAGGRHSGGEGGGGNYDYGDPVQNGGYRFSGQSQGENQDEHDDYGRGGAGSDEGHYEGEGSDSGNQYNSDGNSEGGYQGESGGSYNSYSGNNHAGDGESGYSNYDDFF